MSLAAARLSRSPRMWSPSIGAPRSMSRSMEAISGEPGVVSMEPTRSRYAERGSNPCLAAIALHSPSNFVNTLDAPAATTSPVDARIRQVEPAVVAMNTHFSHMPCRMFSLSSATKLAPDKALTILVATFGSRSVLFSKTQRIQIRQMYNLTLCGKRRRDGALTAEHPFFAEPCVQHI
jgi:hypothetical protein